MSEPADLYRLLVETSPDGILIVRGLRIAFINPAGVRLFGASHANELIGKSPYDIFHPDSHDVIRSRITRLLDGEVLPPAEEMIIRLDGTVTDVEVNSTVVDDPGGEAIQVIVRDITERRQREARLRESEERLRLAFAGAQEGVWDWNLETGAVVYSPRWKEMLGYADDEIEPHISAWEHLPHPDDRPRADALHESLARGASVYEGEFRLRHRQGHYVHVLSRGYPVRREPGGPVIRVVGTHFDLTEREGVEESLLQAQEQLERRVRERTAEVAQANESLRAEM